MTGLKNMIALNKIYAGNCLDILKGWPDKYFDFCFTDPPYNVGGLPYAKNATMKLKGK